MTAHDGTRTRDLHAGAERVQAGGPPAVFIRQQGDSAWLDDLDEIVVAGRLDIPRTLLAAITPAEVVAWARSACTALPSRLLEAVVDDLADVSRVVCDVGGVGQVMVRAFTEAPTRRCGFHIDTVPAQSPTVGALRVYNGATTEYVDPGDVVDMTEFFRYLARRERLSRRVGGEPEADRQLCALDDRPGFLRPGAPVRTVPAYAVVFFRHLDISRHWSADRVEDAWIHRSPMAGTPRLVVNLSPARLVPPGRRRG